MVGIKDDISGNKAQYEQLQATIQEVKAQIKEFENKLRYGNDVITDMEGEQQQLSIEISSAKATIENQNQAYNEMKHALYAAQSTNSDGVSGFPTSSASTLISIPKLHIPQTYQKPLTAARS